MPFHRAFFRFYSLRKCVRRKKKEVHRQTGKFVGDLPVDKAAARKWTLGLSVVLSVVTYGIVCLLHIMEIL